jgi:hypothetical protein
MCVFGSWQSPGYHRQQVTSRIESSSMLLRIAVGTAFSRNRGLPIVHTRFWLANNPSKRTAFSGTVFFLLFLWISLVTRDG